MNLKLLCIAGGVTATILTGPAHADVPAFTYQGFAQAQNYYDLNGGSNGNPRMLDVGSAAGGTAYATPNLNRPSFEVTGTSGDPGFLDKIGPANDTSSTSAYIYFIYYFKINGGGGTVPVDFNYALRAETATAGVYSAGTSALASLVLNNSLSYSYSADSGYTNPTNTSQSVVGTFTADLTYGAVNELNLQVMEHTSGGSGGSNSSASAYVDPRIYIDPAYLAAHPGATLEISPGVGNIGPTATVPEPASWLMMIAGLGAVGGVVRRRRTAAMVYI